MIPDFPNDPDPSVDRHPRVLRWIYRRNDEDLLCQLGLTADHSAYEFRLAPPPNPLGQTTELFNDAVSAFERLTVVERALLDAGWSLESFESQRVPTPIDYSLPQNEIVIMTGS